MDRNRYVLMWLINLSTSLSARRAWIEIFLLVLVFGMPTVALRKESVDRNGMPRMAEGSDLFGRSPQGERG